MTDSSAITIVMFTQIIVSKVYCVLHIRKGDIKKKTVNVSVDIIFFLFLKSIKLIKNSFT